jgi:hypothetical protein
MEFRLRAQSQFTPFPGVFCGGVGGGGQLMPP